MNSVNLIIPNFESSIKKDILLYGIRGLMKTKIKLFWKQP